MGLYFFPLGFCGSAVEDRRLGDFEFLRFYCLPAADLPHNSVLVVGTWGYSCNDELVGKDTYQTGAERESFFFIKLFVCIL